MRYRIHLCLMLVAAALVFPAAAAAATVAALSAPHSAAQCQNVILDASGSNLAEDAFFATIAWDAGSGFGPPIALPPGFETGFPPPPQDMRSTVAFDTPGTYTVGVRLTDTDGTVTTATAVLTVTPTSSSSAPVPVPAFASSVLVAYAGQPVTFDGSASYEVFPGAGCSGNPVTSNQLCGYTWDFGDGAGGTQGPAVVSHSFNTAGTYNVILRVASTDPDGGQASATHTVTVIPAPSPPPPPPPPPPPGVVLPSGRVKVDVKGYVSVKVHCLAKSGVCAGRLQLTGSKRLALASASFSIGAGRSKAIRMRLSGTGRTDVTRAGSKGLAATLSAAAQGAHAAVAPSSRSVRLVETTPKAPRRRRSHR
jgi:PKD domain